jgi:hypothetical protein
VAAFAHIEPKRVGVKQGSYAHGAMRTLGEGPNKKFDGAITDAAYSYFAHGYPKISHVLLLIQHLFAGAKVLSTSGLQMLAKVKKCKKV